MFTVKKSSTQKKCIAELPKRKIILTDGPHDPIPESIWVAMDEENKKMYLLNHAIAMFPYPSWGMELPLQKSIDINNHRAKTPEQTVMIVCKEAYEALERYLDKCGRLDFNKFQEDQLNRAKEQENTEEE